MLKNAEKQVFLRFPAQYGAHDDYTILYILYYIYYYTTLKIQSLDTLDILMNCIKSIKDGLFHHKRPKIAVRAINHP